MENISTVLPKEIAKFYVDLNREIGSGGFARVVLAEHRLTQEKVAIKIMNKFLLKDELPRAYREIEALKILKHQHICQLHEVFETETDIYMVLEYVSGGELFDYIVSQKFLGEKEARGLFRQVISAIAYLHSHGYAHRDLKPENILLDEFRNVKLIDFGLCAHPSGGLINPLLTCCGSPAYAAPELLHGSGYLGNEADIWSMGVLLYTVLCGYLPFNFDQTKTMNSSMKTELFDHPEWLSDEALTLLKKMLVVDPKSRIKIWDMLKEPWVMTGYGSPVSWASTTAATFLLLDQQIINQISEALQQPNSEIEKLLKSTHHNQLTTHYELLLKKKKRMECYNSYRPINLTPRDVGMRSKTWSDDYLPEASINAILCNETFSTRKPAVVASHPDKIKAKCLENAIESYESHYSVRHSIPPLLPRDTSNRENQQPRINTPDFPRECLGDSPPSPHPIKFSLKSSRRQSLSTNDLHLAGPRVLDSNTKHPPTSTNDSAFGANDISIQGTDSINSSGGKNTHTPITPRTKNRIFAKIFDVFYGKRVGDQCLTTLTETNSKCHTPRRIKTAENVLVMSMKSALDVRAELERVLLNMKQRDILASVEFDRYSFKCKKEQSGRKLVFEIEICQLDGMGHGKSVAIRRKRIKGDSWMYKQACEQIFSAIRI